MKSAPDNFSKKVLSAVFIVSASVGVIFLLIFAADLFLLIFAAVLFSVFLTGAGEWIRQRTRLSPSWSIAVVLALLILLMVAFFTTSVSTVSAQLHSLSVSLPKSFQKIADYINNIEWMNRLMAAAPPTLLPSSEVLLGKTAPLIGNVLGGLAATLLVLVLGFYIAIRPQLYADSILRLIPFAERPRVKQFLGEASRRLQAWMAGQFLAMLVTGILTTIGLAVLKVPLSLILGIIAGLLNFIPNFGFILSIIPAITISFAHSPELALYVIMLYVGINILEAYFVTPQIQQHAVNLPPVVLICSQILLGLLFGFVGLILATPLTVVAVLFVRYFYVQRILGERV